MQISFNYQKGKVLQALRYHFISQKEIKFMVIIINVFAIVSAVLLFLKKIRPEPFLLSSFVWVIMALSIWYILPIMVFKKSSAFLDRYNANISTNGLQISTNKGEIFWAWHGFVKHLESPYFFHLYFNEKTFFLIPKEVMNEGELHEFRGYVKEIGDRN